MSDDDSGANNTGSGGWSSWRRLILKLCEDAESAIKRLENSDAAKNSDINVLRALLAKLEARVGDIDAALTAVRERVGTAESGLAEIRSTADRNTTRAKEVEKHTAAVERKHTPSPGVLVEIWRHPAGKVIFGALALGFMAFGFAAYNAVSDAQADINRHLPREESQTP